MIPSRQLPRLLPSQQLRVRGTRAYTQMRGCADGLELTPPVCHCTAAARLIRLDPQQASVNHTLSLNFTGSRRTLTLTNVAFGDVYLCSGQHEKR